MSIRNSSAARPGTSAPGKHAAFRILAPLLLLFCALPASARTVRVAVYQNPPKIFTTDSGEPGGMFVELLQAIARAEGWTLEYVPLSWAEGLAALQRGEIDLMPDVARNAERDRSMDFHEEVVMTAWSQIYARKRFRIDTLTDLNHKRVAVLRDSVQAGFLEGLAAGLDISFELVPAPSFDAAFRAVVANQADAVVANQFYGDEVYRKHGLKKTSVIFNPTSLYFAVQEGRNADLLAAIDRQIRTWQHDPDSPYFQVLARWMHNRNGSEIPQALFLLLLALALCLSITVFFNNLLHRKIGEATASLRATNQALRQSEEKWRGYIEHAPYGIFVIDSSGTYQEVNPAACTMTGYTESELIGHTMDILIPDTFREKGWRSFQLLEENGYMDEEIQLRKANGDLFWARICARRLQDGRFIGFHENIQARKDAEKQHAALQAELFHAQKLDAVGRLAGGIAHDYNNMLGVILGGCELMKMKVPPDAPIRDEIDHIHSAATRSASITRQLLSFSRKQDLCPVNVNLNETVQDLQPLLRHLIEDDIQILWQPCAHPLPVNIDPTFIDQVLMNLCINARDALNGPGTIEIRTDSCYLPEDSAQNTPAGVYARIHVKDNGPGIDPETQKRLFEPFFTTKPQGKGTGLGLSTVYGIVKQARGYIRLRSQPGHGTTFEIGFPLHNQEATA